MKYQQKFKKGSSTETIEQQEVDRIEKILKEVEASGEYSNEVIKNVREAIGGTDSIEDALRKSEQKLKNASDTMIDEFFDNVFPSLEDSVAGAVEDHKGKVSKEELIEGLARDITIAGFAFFEVALLYTQTAGEGKGTEAIERGADVFSKLMVKTLAQAKSE